MAKWYAKNRTVSEVFLPETMVKKMNFYFSIVLDIHKRGKCVYKSHLLILLICYGPYNDTSVETWKDVTFSDLILNISVSCWPELLLLLFEPRLEHWLWHLEVFVYGNWFICTVHQFLCSFLIFSDHISLSLSWQLLYF